MKIYHGILLNIVSLGFIIYVQSSDFDVPLVLKIFMPVFCGIVLFTAYEILFMVMRIIYKVLEPLVDYLSVLDKRIRFPWEKNYKS